MKKLKYFIVLLLCVISFTSCYRSGDYDFIIHMKDGTLRKARNVKSIGGGLSVQTPNGDFYILSSTQYDECHYIGKRNIKD